LLLIVLVVGVVVWKCCVVECAGEPDPTTDC